MRKNSVLRLFLLIAFGVSLYSCIHDDISVSSDPSLQEYTNKSLWKEDEKYIQNVKQVFEEYSDKTYFAANFGTVYWDYALTMGTFDESFLEVPVIKNNKVSFILVAVREGDRVYFKRKEEEGSKEFFNVLVFKNRKELKGRIVSNNDPGSTEPTTEGLVCYTVETTWTWTNDDGSAGPTFVYNETRCGQSGPYLPCQAVDVGANCGGSTGGGQGSGGSGGGGSPVGGYPYPQQPLDPCDKVLGMLSKPGVQPKIKELKDQAPKGGELGVKFKIDGTPSPTIIGEAHSVNFGDKTGYAGGYHNHTPSGIPMFSPPDIDQLLGFAKAQPTSSDNTGNAYLGMVAPNGMHYVMWFNGTYQDAIKTFSQEDLDKYIDKYQQRESELTDKVISGITYINNDGSINNLGVEKLFLETLKNMGLEGKAKLQRIESNGTIQNIKMDINNKPVPEPC